MNKKTKIIIFFVLIILLILFCASKLKQFATPQIDNQDTRVCNVSIDDEGNIKVNEVLKVNIERSQYSVGKGTCNINLFSYTDDMDFDLERNLIRNIKVFVDGEEVLDKDIILNSMKVEIETFDDIMNLDEKIEDINYYLFEGHLTIRNLEYAKHYINIEYELNPKIVNQYNNLSILKIKNNNAFFEYKIKMNFLKDVELFKINTRKVEVNKIQDNCYEIDISKTNEFAKECIELYLDNDIVKEPTKIDKKYDAVSEFREKRSLLIITIIISIILFIAVKILNNRRIIYKNAIKSTKVVLDPIFAESIIDGKIGAKELIMSCIIDLIDKKNIDVVDNNNRIKINNLDGTTEYERKIIDLVFGENKTVSFENLKKMFNINERKTKMFYEKLGIIKEEIKRYFFKENIYSKVGELILKIINIFLLIFMANSILIPIIIVMENEFIYMSELIMWITVYNVIVIMWMMLHNIKRGNIIIRKKQNIDDSLGPVLVLYSIFLFIYLIMFIVCFETYFIEFLLFLITFFLNIITLKKTKIHCLTNKGIVEYNKAYALKNYIKEYSLMEQREMDGVQVWDRYLAYACAFGISTKITDKIDEDTLKINIFYQILKNY